MADDIYQIKVYFGTKLCRHVAALIPPHILLFTLIWQGKMAFVNETHAGKAHFPSVEKNEWKLSALREGFISK